MIRPLLVTELPAMTGVLSDAFMADPLYRALAPSPQARARWLRWLMGTFLRLSHRRGGAFCLAASPTAGAVCLVPPEQGQPSLADYARVAPGLPPLGEGAPAFVRRGLGVARLLARAHVTAEHLYVLAVGVAPCEQGKGVGGALLRASLGLAARRGVPCYLETASARNVALYEHLGFHVHRAFAPKALPPLWTMLRPAAAPLARAGGQAEPSPGPRPAAGACS